MDVLITHADASGTAEQIAERVAAGLRARDLTAHVVPIGTVGDVEQHDAVVIGGAAAGSHWVRPARRFVQQHEEELARRPVWLFSSAAHAGRDELGAPPRPREFDEFDGLVEPEDETVFRVAAGGDEATPTLAGRLLGRLLDQRPSRARPHVDDWSRVDAWTDAIADRLLELQRDRAIDAVHEMRDTE